jgi:hypothetical protein
VVAYQLAAAAGEDARAACENARYSGFLLAESHLTRRLFAAMLRRVELLPLPAR